MRGKRIALGIGILLLLCAGSLFLILPSKGPLFADNCLSVSKLEKLQATLLPTEEDILTEVIFAGEILPWSRESGTFYLPVDMDEAEWEAGKLSAGDPGVEIYLLENPLEDEKQAAIKEGKKYPLLAVKGNVYREYAIVFSGLPILSIETEEEIRYEEVYGSMRFFQSDSKEDWVMESLMSAHIRGGSSRLNPKKAYKMTLYKQNQTGVGALRENQVSLLDMREDDEWLLYAIYSEDTKVRDKLSLDIWNESGALEVDSQGHYGYHMEYIEVFQNGDYYGLYGLMEPVDYKQLDLTKEGETAPEDFLYKQKDPEVYELKGNHLADDEAHREVLNTYLTYLDAEDEIFAEKMPELIDADNALDVWIYLQAVMGMDNIQRNIFYPARYENGQYRMYFVPWDMDYSWGNVHDFEAGNRTRFSEEILTMRIAWKLGDRLVRLDVNGAREKVTKRWQELRQTVYSDEYLCEQIDAYAHQVIDSGAFGRDASTWIMSAHNSDYEGLKTLACERMEFLDAHLEDPLEYLDLKEYVE